MFPLGILSRRVSFAANEVLHLDFEGANGSTTITDSLGRHSPIAFGSAAISTAWSSAGSSSLLLPSGSNYVQVRATYSADFVHPADFSYKCVVNVSSLSALLWVFFNTAPATGGPDGTTNRFSVTINATTGIVKLNAGTVNLTGTAVSVGVPQTIEVKRVGTTVSLIQNGTTTASTTSSNNFGAGYLGIAGHISTGHFNGYIGKFVVTKG